jgi:hypothetical protein
MASGKGCSFGSWQVNQKLAPKEAIEARRKQANAALRNDHYHAVANPAKGRRPVSPTVGNKGYRPDRRHRVRWAKPGRGPKPQ